MPDIQPGDVLFVWGHDLIDKEIEHVSRGPSHVAMFVNPTTVAEAQGGRLVGEFDLSFYLDGDAYLEVWEDPTLTDQERAGMVNFAKTLYGTPYDYALIPLEFAHFETGVKLSWYHENKHLICSTFVETIAEHVNRKWTNVSNGAPEDLLVGGVLQKKLVLTKGFTEIA